MPKIVLSLEENMIREFDLDKEETTIGRRSTNDIQIQNLAVSGRHARIKVALDDAFLEDLGSTNGTYVNGRLIKKQALNDGDEIIIGKYKLVYYATPATAEPALSSMLHTNTDETDGDGQAKAAENPNSAIIEVKNGAKAGQILPLQKPVTTLGRPGIQIAAIMKKPEGYFFMHIESEDEDSRPRHNQAEIGEEPVLLSSGDNLTVAGISVEFMLS
ncbi:FHA domain-containing protein [Granulosicoccaceae sp. 1_MG-2023]|nr:FHA domain-containing protein [Granulosicoccaceae sp. 1_MG-2023]